MGIFSSILGAVAGPLIGGIFGSKKPEPQTTTSRIDLKQIIKDSEASGFNPTTVLRSVGGGFSTTTTSGGVSRPGLFQSIGSGLAAGVQAAFDYNPLDEQRAQVEYGIQKAQLRRINQSPNYYPGLGDGGVATGSRYQTTIPKTNVTKQTLANGLNPFAGETMVTNPYPVGSRWQVNPDFKDAEMSETRYGDIIQEIAGVGNLVVDTAHNVNRLVSRLPTDGGTGFWGPFPSYTEYLKPKKHRQQSGGW